MKVVHESEYIISVIEELEIFSLFTQLMELMDDLIKKIAHLKRRK